MRMFLASLALAALVTLPARAACGPDKLGVSRVVEVGTQGGLLVGLKTYDKTIKLAEHEVILTFDDGPDAQHTPDVLRALAEQCVHATFFAIGAKVDALSDLARREVLEGHTVAYHTYTHPQPTLRYMSQAAARADILKGIVAVERAAYAEPFADGAPTDLSAIKMHAPFFRFPGFADTADLRGWFAAHDIGIFGTDLWASDWVKMTPKQELDLILARLEKPKRGMLLLHDDKPWTAAMLPDFLRELKTRGYRIVHMVAGPGQGPTMDAPPGWASETERGLSALKPRLEKAASEPRRGPIEVKPAPTE